MTFDLTERMRELGAYSPEAWAHSERHENIPQQARWLVIRKLWQNIDEFKVEGLDGIPVAQRLIASGADPQEVSTAMRYAAYAAVFGVMMILDEGRDWEAPADSPWWLLMEATADEQGEPQLTGRQIGGLHESVLSADPSGREGADLFA